MTLAEYLEQHKLSQREFASRFTPPVTTGLIWQWILWQTDPTAKHATRISAEKAVEIERITRGILKRSELRPDLFDLAA